MIYPGEGRPLIQTVTEYRAYLNWFEENISSCAPLKMAVLDHDLQEAQLTQGKSEHKGTQSPHRKQAANTLPSSIELKRSLKLQIDAEPAAATTQNGELPLS